MNSDLKTRMGIGQVGELIVIVGVIGVFGAIIAMATGQSAPVDLEFLSWIAAAVTFLGVVLAFLGN